MSGEHSNIAQLRVEKTSEVCRGSGYRVTDDLVLTATHVVADSGRITVADATSADIRTSSARVEVGRTSEECCVRTSSGRVEIGACGSADVTTVSGRIVVQAANGPVRAHCVSGRVEVGLMAPEDVAAETVSGRIHVTVPQGVAVSTNDDRSLLTAWPGGAESSITARTVSGRVDVSSK